MTGPAAASPWRHRAATLLIALAAIGLCAAAVTQYAGNALLDSRHFAERSASALQEPEVRQYLGREIADGAVSANPDLIAVRPLLESAGASVVGSGAFRSVFEAAVRDLHRAVIERDQDAVVLVLADVGVVLRAAVGKLDPAIAAKIDSRTDVRVLDDRVSAQIADAARTLDDLRSAAPVLLLLALALAGAALWLGPDRRRVAFAGGVALAAAALVSLLALGIARRAALGEIGDPAARDAAGAVWRSVFGDLRTALLLIAVAGTIVAAAARSLLRVVSLETPLRRAWTLVTTTPESTRWRVVRALALLAAGVLVLVDAQAILDLVLFGAGLLLLSAGVNELIRLTTAPKGAASADEPGDERTGRRRRVTRVAIAGVLALAALGIASALVVQEGGVTVAAPTLTSCNGHRALCAKRLNEVTLAGTHNSMSAATNPGWLFAQQDAGIDAQLRDGVHALLIDTHYGRPAGGRIKTELEGDAASRAKLEAEIGPEAVDAALRIRNRIEGASTGPRGVYLCHALCELGALPLSTALGQIRDYLADNPREVLTVVVEDAVKPADFVKAFRKAGLERWVYEGPWRPPWPTLRTMIRDDRRLVVLAEKQRGGAPWLHPAFAAMQETPYSFRRVAQLTDPAMLPASCRENRGEPGASLFQVNHWIDTSPAPKPSNADRVNAHGPLLRRARVCQQQRSLMPNVLAVDFYRRGDLFGVVDELNGVR